MRSYNVERPGRAYCVFLRGGSEPTFGAAQTDIFTSHALSLPCARRLLLLFSADIPCYYIETHRICQVGLVPGNALIRKISIVLSGVFVYNSKII